MTLILTFLLIFFPAETPPQKIGGVIVYGELTKPEETVLTELEKYHIPLPDTIRVEYRKRDRGFIKKGTSTVVLAKNRHSTPESASGDPPYLYGRTSARLTLPLVSEYKTLAHEIAHFLQWRVLDGKPLLKPPLWWKIDGVVNPYRMQVETEADLMAAALAQIVFEAPVKAFGFPEQIWDGDVQPLVRTYKARILDYYRVTQQ